MDYVDARPTEGWAGLNDVVDRLPHMPSQLGVQTLVPAIELGRGYRFSGAALSPSCPGIVH
jgi:hypothetical protein